MSKSGSGPVINCLVGGVDVDLNDADALAAALCPHVVVVALSYVKRYGGAAAPIPDADGNHAFIPISVAAHSMLVARIARHINPEAVGWALLHDAHEIILGDLTQPGQELLAHVAGHYEYAVRGAVGAAREHIDEAVRSRYRPKYSETIARAVDTADRAAAAIEMKCLFGRSSGLMPDGITVARAEDLFRSVWPDPQEAVGEFMDALVALDRGKPAALN